jgi:hypothetical protein
MPPTLPFILYLGILLHGVCYDFFFVTGRSIPTKRHEESGPRAGLITLATYGIGMLIAFG